MRKLDINEFKLCQILGSIFEKSIDLSNQSSPMFIRRFMTYDGTKTFFDKSYLSLSCNEEDIIYELNNLYQPPNNKVLYSANEMYWIGYIYGALAFLYELSGKTIYELFPAKEIVKYYKIGHTFSIEQAAERMMESKNYQKKDFTAEGVKIFKRLNLLDDLKSLIGKKVRVYVDMPMGYVKEDLTYKVNCGYIKELKDIDCKYQRAYILGVNESIDDFIGTVYAIINRTNDNKDTLVVVNEGTNYSIKEIKQQINFIEKNYKYKIIM